MPFPASPTHRISTRGELQTFKAAFFADEAKTTPLEPLDPAQYPSFSIYDINNTLIQSGTAILDGTAGNYKVDFQVPSNAVLSYDENRWRIEWVMVTSGNRQVDFIEAFDVRDIVVTSSQNRELQVVALELRPFQIALRLTTRPVDLKLDVTVARNSNTKIVDNISIGPTGIVEVVDGDSYLYAYEIGSNLLQPNTLYTALWAIKDTSGSTTRFEFQQVVSIAQMMLPMMTSLRMLIDKFQKRLGRIHAYEDSDLIEYLARGQDWVNAGYPTTMYSISSTPSGLLYFTVLAASVWALQAQGLLEVDLGFNFSGQSITLDTGDRSSQLDAYVSKTVEWLNTNLPPAKMSYVRRQRGTGCVAGRPYRLNALYNFVYKLQTFNSGDFMTMMTKIGIL